jgi:energy-coupling factor transport system permease protein
VSFDLPPSAVLPLALGLSTLAFLHDHPLVLGATACAALLLAGRAAPRARIAVTIGAVGAVLVALLNPFVAEEGNLILVAGPHLPIFDLEVTLEEVAYGAAAGARLFAVTVVVGAALALVDGDRLTAAVSRVAPRSALTASLATRLLPTLRRDARAVAETARLRGLSADGPRRTTLRRWGPLLVPLTAAGLERGLDVAEAMAARGYGQGPVTRLPERPLTGSERIAGAVGGLVLAVAVAARLLDLAPYAYYPRLEDATAAGAVGVSVVALVATAVVTVTLRAAR